jgi:hypothetical protein
MLRKLLLGVTLSVVASAANAAAALPSHKAGLAPPTATVAAPALDGAKAVAEDAARGRGRPLRYAIGTPVAVGASAASKARGGQWDTLPDGRRVWRLRVEAPGAISVDLGFADLFLPAGAELYVASHDGAVVRGPYTDADNPPNGRFHAPLVPGDVALVELVVPDALARHARLELALIRSGYRDVLTGRSPYTPKSLNCHIDSICPDGDAIREQIRGVAGYTFGGIDGLLCTGQLLNNVRQDNARLFETANHCVSDQATADSVVVYWKYESPTCRTRFTSANGTPISLSVAVPQTGGATLRATHAGTDMTLLELRTAVPAQADPFWNGWDRRDVAPTRSFIVHHSNGDEKRLSFDDNPAVVNGTPVTIDTINYPAFASMDVTYDRMTTTEGGASGGGLFDQNERVVGQLGGGPAGSCSVAITDTYGRFAVSWEGGGSASSRLRSWLDPDDTGAQFLDGKGACAAPGVSLTGPATGRAGTALTFTVTPTGSGPFTVEWDVDADGLVDRRVTGVTGATSISPSYPLARTGNVVARATDATGCAGQASRALVVTAPDVVAAAQAPQAVCGDADALIEPGETWRVPVRLRNQGPDALDDGVAIFTELAFPGGATATRDAAGHLMLDNTSADCPFQFVDIQTTGALLTASSDDDGRTAALPLGPAGLDLYDTHADALVMSTNGYLSTSPSESGGDFDNTCALEAPNRGSEGALLRVLHDDLVVRPEGSLRRQYFTSCPRAADSGGAPRGCTVFQWTRMTRYVSSTTTDGDFTFQALVYDGTGEIVYQYLTADPLAGGSATVSIQDAGATDRLQYACNQQGAVPAGRAVCYFAPHSAPATPIQLRTPAFPLGNLAPGGEQTANVEFHVPASAGCGRRLELGYAGTVDDRSASMRAATLFDTAIGAGGACAAVEAGCASVPATPPPIVPSDGLFANPNRFGNGIGSFVIPQGAGAPAVYFGAWFTGEASRAPTWLVLQGPFEGFNGPSQALTDVLRFTFAADQFPPLFQTTSRRVGKAQITTLSATEYVLTFTLDGVAGGEKQSILYPGPRPSPNRTGAWYYPQESGWGHIVDDHRLGGTTPEQVAIEYIYGADGVARWTLGASNDLDAGAMAQTTFLVHCPTCPSFADFLSFPLAAGSISRSYSSLTEGALSTFITLPAPLSGTWNRTSVPILLLTVPGPQ